MNSCKDCKFAICSDNVQTGCECNKIEKFVEQNTASMGENGFYNLNRLCMFKRFVDWEGSLEDETQIKMGYIFILNSESNFDQLEYNINQIKDKSPLWIGVICTNAQPKKSIIELLNSIGCKYNIITDYLEKQEWFYIDTFIKHIKNGWTLVNIVGKEFIVDAKEKMHQVINEDLRVIGLVTPEEDSLNGICFFNIFFKYHKGSLPIFDEESDSYIVESFENKMRRNNPELVVSWSEL